MGNRRSGERETGVPEENSQRLMIMGVAGQCSPGLGEGDSKNTKLTPVLPGREGKGAAPLCLSEREWPGSPLLA